MSLSKLQYPGLIRYLQNRPKDKKQTGTAMSPSQWKYYYR